MKKTTIPIKEHYSAHVIDLHTIVVIAHFIDDEDGYVPLCGFSKYTINVDQPISASDESYLSEPGNELFRPASIGEFHANLDDDTHAELLRAMGENPEETYARWAADDDKDYCGKWIEIKDRMPEPGSRVLIHLTDGSMMGADWNGTEWIKDNESPIGLPISHWTPMPCKPFTGF